MQPETEITLSRPVSRRYNVIGVHRGDSIVLKFDLSENPEWVSLGYYLSIRNQDDRSLIISEEIDGESLTITIPEYDKGNIKAICVVEDQYGEDSIDTIDTIGYIIFRQFSGGVKRVQAGTVLYSDADGNDLEVPYYTTELIADGLLNPPAPEDTTKPAPTLSTTASDPTSLNNIPFTASWSEDVQGFAVEDIDVTNGTASGFTQLSASEYTFDVTPDGDGEVRVGIPADVCTDLAGNNNTAATTISLDSDRTAPTPTISSDANQDVNSLIEVTITFDENVVGFASSSLSLTNCTAQNFTKVSDSIYTVELVPTTDGQFSVGVPADVCQDDAGNDNDASNTLSRTYDSTAPTPVISSSENDPTAADPIPIAVDFGEVVSGFTQADVTVSGGTISGFTDVDGQNYTFNISPDSNNEDIKVNIGVGIAIDDAGNPNDAATEFTITHDSAGPVPTISSSANDPTATDPIPITISFDEPVTGFAIGDITATNANLSNFVEVDSQTFTVDASPTSDPTTVSIDVAADVCTDALGNGNDAATTFEIGYDSVVPTPVITTTESEPSNASTIPIEVDFGETVSGFEAGDVNAGNANVINFVNVDGQVYTFDLDPTITDGTLTVDIPQGVATDGSGSPNNAATQFTFDYDAAGDKPVITSSEDTYTQADPIPLTITFPEAQTGFTVGDITVGNGTVDTFVDVGGGVYTCNLNPTADGACTIDISGGVCTDQAGNNNVAADQFTIFHDTADPTVSNADLDVDPITEDGGTVGWTRATDLVSDQEDLFYELYSSLSDNITTVQNALDNGTLEGDGTNINTLDITGKNDGDQVWIKVLCYDQAGNILGYTTTSFIVNDGIPPTIPSPGISTEDVGEHTFDMVFQEAEDNVTVHADMKYHGYTSEEDNISTIADAEANGTFHETVTGELRITCDGLITDTPYYGVVIAEDEGGNKAIYDVVQQRTAKFGDAVLEQAQIFP